jgi:hypothetical protein
MCVTNNARQLTGVSDSPDERGSVRFPRATGLRVPLWIFAGLLLWLLSAPFAGAATQLPVDKRCGSVPTRLSSFMQNSHDTARTILT